MTQQDLQRVYKTMQNLDLVKQFVVSTSACKNRVIPSLDAFSENDELKGNIIFPFNFDSEFVTLTNPIDIIDCTHIKERMGVTVQIRGINQAQGKIYAHYDLENYANDNGLTLRHSVMSEDWVFIQYLRDNGIDCETYQDEYTDKMPTCKLQLCAHFAIADLTMLCGQIESYNTIKALYQNKQLQMTRRLVAKSKYANVIKLGAYCIRIEDTQYRLQLEIIDTNALHGASYADTASNVGFELPYKDLITRGNSGDITRMQQVYFERPIDFDNYALGDLHVSDILYAHERMWKKIYDDLDIGHLYNKIKMSMGSADADIIRARLMRLLGIDELKDKEDKDYFQLHTTHFHNASYLTRLSDDRNCAMLLSKVDGGRCKYSKPIVDRLEGALVDIDVGGFYASIMSITPMILGKARIDNYDNSCADVSQLRNCPSLGDWLKKHGKKIVDRSYVLRVSTNTDFSFENDLIPSWHSFTIKDRKSDSELQGLDTRLDVASGVIRYYSTQVINGIITSDLIDVAQNMFSSAQFAEWSNKLTVRCAAYTYKEDHLTPVEYAIKYHNQTLSEYDWTSVTLGELITDVALALRKQYKKKTALNILFKLIANVVYGDSVSRHFDTSSVITGNNVTGTARAFIYLSEKALNMQGAITDGQLFNLSSVLYPKLKQRKGIPDCAINTRAYLMTGKDISANQFAYRPLIGKKVSLQFIESDAILTIEKEDGAIVTLHNQDALDLIDKCAIEHVAKLYPNVQLVKMICNRVVRMKEDHTVEYKQVQGAFSFESKSLVASGSFHASANYQFVTPNGEKTAMRGYESKRLHQSFTYLNDALVLLDMYADISPAQYIMSAIRKGISFKLPAPFIKERILKPSQYQLNGLFESGNENKFEKTNILAGDSILVIGQPRIFSLSQFTFKTRSQYKIWQKARQELINKTGFSFEAWFLDSAGQLDFALMIKTLDALIVDDCVKPIAVLRKMRGKGELPEYAQAYFVAVNQAKKNLAIMYQKSADDMFADDTDDNDSDDSEAR